MTLEAWVYPTAAQPSWRTVLVKEQHRRPLLRPVRQHEHQPPERARPHERRGRHPRHRGAGGRTWTHLAATYDGAHAAPVRQRHAGREQGDRRLAERHHRRPAHRRQRRSRASTSTARSTRSAIYNRALTAARSQTDMGRAVVPAVNDATPPTAPTNLTATGGARARDAGLDGRRRRHGVARYNVHRSTTAGLHADRRQPHRAADGHLVRRHHGARGHAGSTRSPPRTRPATSAPPPTRRRRS